MPVLSEKDGLQRFMNLKEEGHHWLHIINYSIIFHLCYAVLFVELNLYISIIPEINQQFLHTNEKIFHFDILANWLPIH